MARVVHLPSVPFISLLLSRLLLLSSIAVNDAIRLRVRITDIWFVPVRGHLLLVWAEMFPGKALSLNSPTFVPELTCKFSLRLTGSLMLMTGDRWEFITTLNFEWEVYTGKRPFNWSFIVYVTARILALICIVLSLVVFNVTRHLDCDVHPLVIV